MSDIKKFLLRLSPDLYDALVEKATRDGMSVNRMIESELRKSLDLGVVPIMRERAKPSKAVAHERPREREEKPAAVRLDDLDLDDVSAREMCQYSEYVEQTGCQMHCGKPAHSPRVGHGDWYEVSS
jgi:hypothetical protein